MREVLIPVLDCHHCPKHTAGHRGGRVVSLCISTNRKIPMDGIPDWCPYLYGKTIAEINGIITKEKDKA